MSATPDLDGSSCRIVRLLLLGVLLISFAASLTFISQKSAPRGLDELDVFAEGVYYHTAGAGLLGLWSMQIDPEIGCPPLLPWVGWIMGRVLGRGYPQLAASSALFQLVLLLSLYGIGRRVSGTTAGLLAAAAGAISPIAVSYSRIFTTNLPALAMLAAALWALLWSERFTRRWSGVLVGLLIGLANLAERGTPPLALAMPVIFWCLFSAFSARRDRTVLWGVLGRVAAAAAVSLALSGRYLHFYFFRTAGHIAELGSQDIFGDRSQHVVERLPEWLYYPAALPSMQLGIALAALLLIGLPFFLRRLNPERVLLLVQMLWPMAVMTPFASKMYDFDLGTLAGALPLLGVGLADIPWRAPRRVAIAGAGLLLAATFWVINPSVLPHPRWPLKIDDWLGRLNNVGLLMPSDTVYQDRIQRELIKRLPQGQDYLFVYRVEPSGPLDNLICETTNFAWLHQLGSEQYALLDPAVAPGGLIKVELWPLSASDRQAYRAAYYRPPCAFVSYDLPVAPPRPAECRSIYAADVDGREFEFARCQ